MKGSNLIFPPITWVGGKSSAIKEHQVNEFIPPLTDNHSVYAEIFFGSGAIFWNIETRSCIINDLDNDLFNFWEIMGSASLFPIFQEKLEEIFLGKKWLDKYENPSWDLITTLTKEELTSLKLLLNGCPSPITKEVFIEKIDHAISLVDIRINQALKFYLMNRNAIGGNMGKKWNNTAKPKPFRKDLTPWFNKLSNTYHQIWNLDFRKAMEILNRHENKGREKYTIVLDPPYIEQGDIYRHGFVEQDHKDLCELCHQCPHQIFLFYDNNTKITEDLYKDFHKFEYKVSYFNSKRKGNEVLLSNRPLKRYSHNLSNSTILSLDKFVSKK